MKKLSLSLILLFIAISSSLLVAQNKINKPAYIMTLKGGISPATEAYVEKGLRLAAESNGLVVIQLDTPGGLLSATRGIVEAILNSPVPVITYVAPSGAHAASAGTFMLYASSLAAMAPGTNVGAASPIALFKSARKDIELTKSQNDAAAWIKSLAQLHNRNPEWGQSAVLQAASLSAEEALKEKVIDILAPDISSLLEQANNRSVIVNGQSQILHTEHMILTPLTPNWHEQFMMVLAEPAVIYILLLLAIYGILFELFSPGKILPGVVGVICALLAIYGLRILPVNFVGLALILVGIALLIVELFITSFGVIAIGGLVAFFVGSMFLFDSILGSQITWSVAAAFSIVTAAFFLIVLRIIIQAQRRPVLTGKEELLRETGTVISIHDHYILIQLHGELWQAKKIDSVTVGDTVKVISHKGLELEVKKE